ncbi:transcription factor atf21 [Fusarium beomiforme]|uniref:Transcription factor atf21 n=1 Tax=Fusarium beomiforme TaxID=44412 RepID=A0A9P5ADM6_9HYPO|nr:transcription factor atf21 [Fusarium beomiforme]
MDGPGQEYGGQAPNFQPNFSLPSADDANIDPLLEVCTTGGQAPPSITNPMDDQILMGSSMWNMMNNPIGFYPPNMSTMAPTALINSSKAPTETPSSPRTPSSEPMFGSTRNSSKSSIPSVNSANTDTKPRRSSRTTKTQRQQPAVEPVAKAPRRRRASKEPSLNEEAEDEDDSVLDESAKRTKFLKRNRIAASKCRQKKKEWVNNLEDTRYGLEHENNVLHKQYNGLVDELSTIKNQLMQHASCNDANINQWLDNEAKKFVQRIAAQSQQAPQVKPDPGDFGGFHRRSSSGM